MSAPAPRSNADPSQHAPADTPASAIASINDADLLSIVESTIDPTRLAQIRDALTEDTALLAELSRMKRDRQLLISAAAADDAAAPSPSPAALVNAALMRATDPTQAITLPYDFDEPPAWPTDETPAPALHAAASRVHPNLGRQRHRLGWQGKAALAASLLLTLTLALGITKMLGGLDPDRRFKRHAIPEAALANTTTDTPQTPSSRNYTYEAMLKRQELTEELAKLLDRPEPLPANLEELDLAAVQANSQTIDDILALIASDLVLNLDDAAQTDPALANASTVRRTVITNHINQALIGQLAQAGRLHLAVQAGDATSTMFKLLDPSESAGSTAVAYSTQQLELDERSFTSLEEARSIAAPPPPKPDALASPLDMTVPPPPEDPQLERIEQLQRELRELYAIQQSTPLTYEKNDPVYRITLPELHALTPDEAGQAVIALLEQIISDGDQIAFYELAHSVTAPAAPPASPQAGPPSPEPGLTLHLIPRARLRR